MNMNKPLKIENKVLKIVKDWKVFCQKIERTSGSSPKNASARHKNLICLRKVFLCDEI